MATLLRVLIAVIGFVALQGGIVVLVLDGTRVSEGAGAVAIFGLALVGIVPPLAGLSASYWTWTGPEARRGLRRAGVVMLALQLAGAAAMVGAGFEGAIPVGIAVLVLLAALVLDVMLAALGRAARRSEARHPRQVPEWQGDIEEHLRRGWRNGAIGGAVGSAVVAAGGLAVALLLGDRAIQVSDVFPLAGIVLVATAIGMQLSVLPISRRTRELIGSDYGLARRIGRAVRGKPASLDAEEQERAARVARVTVRLMPFQLTASVLMLLAAVVIDVGSAVDRGPDLLQAISLTAILAAVLIAVPAAVVRARRIRAYAAAHPVA